MPHRHSVAHPAAAAGLRTAGVLPGLQSSVVLGLGFCGWAAPEPVHKPGALYQATHAEVMFSRSARVRIGPLRNGEPSRTHSVLYSPIVVSQKALSRASPTVPIDGLSPSSISVSLKCIAVYLTSGVAMVDRVVERVALAGAEGCGVAQRTLDEAVSLVSEHSQPGISPA